MVAAIYYSRAAGFPGMGLPIAMFAGLMSLLGSGPGMYTVGKMKLREPKNL